MEFQDQLGYKIYLKEYPKRIISLVPSITELLFDLGLNDEIAGITRYCILPKEQTEKITKVGGTKKFDFDIINELRPNLIIGNKEENYKEGIYKLKEKYPVWLSDVATIDDAINMIESIGMLVNKYDESKKLAEQIKKGLFTIKNQPEYKTAYLIWKNPYMTIGGDTFINDMLKTSGFINIFEKQKRYPKINLDALEEAELILLSSEPYPFTKEDIELVKGKFKNKLVFLVDGKIFSWYGSRLKYAAGYINDFRVNLNKRLQ